MIATYVNKKSFKCKRLVICAQEPDNLQKTLTMLIEDKGKDGDIVAFTVKANDKEEDQVFTYSSIASSIRWLRAT